MFSKTLSNWSTLNVKQQLSIDCIIDALGRPATIVERLYSRKSTTQYCFFCFLLGNEFKACMSRNQSYLNLNFCWVWTFVEVEYNYAMCIIGLSNFHYVKNLKLRDKPYYGCLFGNWNITTKVQTYIKVHASVLEQQVKLIHWCHRSNSNH